LGQKGLEGKGRKTPHARTHSAEALPSRPFVPLPFLSFLFCTSPTLPRPPSPPLQVAPRRSHRGHASPFLCTFVPDHTSLALGQLKQLDAQMRNGAFPELARIATDVNGRSHGDDSCSGGAGNGGCNGEGHGGCSGDEGSRSSGNGVGNGHGACAPRAANGATAAAPAPEQVEFYFWERLAAEREARLLYASDVEGTAFPAAGAQGRTISRDERRATAGTRTHTVGGGAPAARLSVWPGCIRSHTLHESALHSSLPLPYAHARAHPLPLYHAHLPS
jgi:hypothetical protein